LQHTKAPFTKVILCDINNKNIEALRRRAAPFDDGRVVIIQGDSNERIDEVVGQIPPSGLNIALLDPFGVSGLAFETVSRLARFERMDLIIHFPIGDMKRNWQQERARFERFLGVPYADWGFELNGPEDVSRLIPVLRSRLAGFGYDVKDKLHSPSVKNTKNVVLYVLVYASKHDTGKKIWKSITKTTPTGQKTLPIRGLD